MKNIIFVCTGNTCRSPMAEAIAKSLCNNKDINIFSRGIYAQNGLNINTNAKIALQNNNICFDTHCSKALTLEDIKNATLILTMEKQHKNILEEIKSKSIREHLIDNYNISYDNKLYTLYEYVLNKDLDIKDPFGSNIEVYNDCFNEIYNLIVKIDFNNI